MPISQENTEQRNYIYHHPDVNSGFRLLSTFAKLLELQAMSLGWDRLSESLGGYGVNPGEKEALILMAVGGLTLIGNMRVDAKANKTVSTNVDIIVE